MKPRAYFARHPVFTHEDFVRAHTAAGRSEHTSNAALAQAVEVGRLVRIRRGLYASVAPDCTPDAAQPDPYLVASKLQPDAVVAYHAALALHGVAYSEWNRVQYVTAARVRAFKFQGVEFVGEQAPAAVRLLPEFGGGVLVRAHAGGEVRVTSLERTMVDSLHAPSRIGDWEELWRSLTAAPYMDLDEVERFALLHGSALTAARVGFLLEHRREAWMVEDKHLRALAKHAPKQARYLDGRHERGRLVKPWNLIVPERVLERHWEEPA